MKLGTRAFGYNEKTRYVFYLDLHAFYINENTRRSRMYNTGTVKQTILYCANKNMKLRFSKSAIYYEIK